MYNIHPNHRGTKLLLGAHLYVLLVIYQLHVNYVASRGIMETEVVPSVSNSFLVQLLTRIIPALIATIGRLGI